MALETDILLFRLGYRDIKVLDLTPEQLSALEVDGCDRDKLERMFDDPDFFHLPRVTRG